MARLTGWSLNMHGDAEIANGVVDELLKVDGTAAQILAALDSDQRGGRRSNGRQDVSGAAIYHPEQAARQPNFNDEDEDDDVADLDDDFEDLGEEDDFDEEDSYDDDFEDFDDFDEEEDEDEEY